MSLSNSKPHETPCGQTQRLAALAALSLLALMLFGCGGSGSSTSGPTGGTSLNHYSYTDLGSAGPTGTIPTGISDAGVITGYFRNGTGRLQQFRHTGTTTVALTDALVLPSGVAMDTVFYANINATGTVVGTVFTNNTNSMVIQDAFVYDTSFHDIGTLPLAIGGRSVASATAINDSGVAVGYDECIDKGVTHAFRHVGTGPLTAADDLGTFGSYTSVRPTSVDQGGVTAGIAAVSDDSIVHAFIYDTSFHDLGVLPGTVNSFATGINSNGVVVGYGQGSAGLHSFRHIGTGPLTAADDLGQLPGISSLIITAINAGGDAVGNAFDPTVPTAVILKAGGALQSLNNNTLVTNLPAGFSLQIATAINSKGQVVGYTNVGSTPHAWLLTPMP